MSKADEVKGHGLADSHEYLTAKLDIRYTTCVREQGRSFIGSRVTYSAIELPDERFLLITSQPVAGLKDSPTSRVIDGFQRQILNADDFHRQYTPVVEGTTVTKGWLARHIAEQAAKSGKHEVGGI